MAKAVARTDKPPRNVTETENGGTVRRTPEEVDLCLKVLILNGGDAKGSQEQLRATGLDIERHSLTEWRDRAFPRRYSQLRRDLGREVSEEVAGRALERALELDKAEQVYIGKALAKVDEVDANHLAKNAYALANAKSQNVEKAQLLRNQPTSIQRVDWEDAMRILERLNVAQSIESEVEVFDAEEIAA